MAAKQNKLFEVCVKGIVCLTNIIVETDTDAHYVYFALTLFKAEQSSVVVKAQTLPIFIKTAQN